MYNLALLELFGLLIVRPAAPEAGKGWRAEWLQRTAFGDALLRLLVIAVKQEPRGNEPPLMFRSPNYPDVPFGVLHPMVATYFAAWQHNFELPGVAFRAGLYIFKVALGKELWRRIAIPAEASLAELSSAILVAYRFDYDHLYHFIFRNRFGAEEEVNHPCMDEPPLVTDFRVGDLPLQPGETMVYNYDFGDNWRFQVTLERIDPPDHRVKTAKVLEKKVRPGNTNLQVGAAP